MRELPTTSQELTAWCLSNQNYCMCRLDEFEKWLMCYKNRFYKYLSRKPCPGTRSCVFDIYLCDRLVCRFKVARNQTSRLHSLTKDLVINDNAS